jgi:recombinational DNA repair protein (RecF pathway)
MGVDMMNFDGRIGFVVPALRTMQSKHLRHRTQPFENPIQFSWCLYIIDFRSGLIADD